MLFKYSLVIYFHLIFGEIGCMVGKGFIFLAMQHMSNFMDTVFQSGIIFWAIKVLSKMLHVLEGFSYFFFYCFRTLGFSLLQCLNHLKSLLYKMKIIFSFALSHMDVQFSQHHLLKRLPIANGWFWKPCQKWGGNSYDGLLLGLLYSIGLFPGFSASSMVFLLLRYYMTLLPLPFLLRISLTIWLSFVLMYES